MSEPDPLPTEALTWAGLLARWVEFAQSAVGLPDAGDPGRLKASVPDIVMLQAVWFALGQLESLPTAERALALDRAAVLIDRHTNALKQWWGGSEPPAALLELVKDARARLAAAQAEA